jgi:hypothetical protein
VFYENERLSEGRNRRSMKRVTRNDLGIRREILVESKLFWSFYRCLSCYDGTDFCRCNMGYQKTFDFPDRWDEQGANCATTASINSASTEYIIQSDERETPWPSRNTFTAGIPAQAGSGIRGRVETSLIAYHRTAALLDRTFRTCRRHEF